MRVSVERYIEEVDEDHYKGYVKITDTKLHYDLRFFTPISQMDAMTSPKNKDNIYGLFQLTMRRRDVKIELTEKEYGFFFQMVMPFVDEFYSNSHIRDSNECVMGTILREQDIRATFEDTLWYSVIHRGLYDFSPKLCEMLNDPKFGCALVV